MNTTKQETGKQGLGGGLYQDRATGNFYHRPKVDGRDTWRAIPMSTDGDARIWLADYKRSKQRAAVGLERSPDAPKELVIMADVLKHWIALGCPRRRNKPQTKKKLPQFVAMAQRLESFWGQLPVAHLRPAHMRDFLAKRKAELPRAGALADIERACVCKALRCAAQDERINRNPFAEIEFDTVYEVGAVKHCREFMPRNADDLHKMARFLFEKTMRSEVFGWQLLIEAYTGLRTHEALMLRWDAKAGEAGFIDGNILHVKRGKGGINPYVEITPALRQTIAALKEWHKARGNGSPWWFPSSKDAAKPAEITALSFRLKLYSVKVLGYRVRSHGCRAFYVTALRSEFVPDALIAAKIGDATGAAIITQIYGGLPPNWTDTKVGKVSWMPKKGKLAWLAFSDPASPMRRRVVSRKTAPALVKLAVLPPVRYTAPYTVVGQSQAA